MCRGVPKPACRIFLKHRQGWMNVLSQMAVRINQIQLSAGNCTRTSIYCLQISISFATYRNSDCNSGQSSLPLSCWFELSNESLRRGKFSLVVSQLIHLRDSVDWAGLHCTWAEDAHVKTIYHKYAIKMDTISTRRAKFTSLRSNFRLTITACPVSLRS